MQCNMQYILYTYLPIMKDIAITVANTATVKNT